MSIRPHKSLLINHNYVKRIQNYLVQATRKYSCPQAEQTHINRFMVKHPHSHLSQQSGFVIILKYSRESTTRLTACLSSLVRYQTSVFAALHVCVKLTDGEKRPEACCINWWWGIHAAISMRLRAIGEQHKSGELAQTQSVAHTKLQKIEKVPSECW